MNRSIIIMPFHNPLAWYADYATQTAIHLARHHMVLCFRWGDAVSVKEIVLDGKRYAPLTREADMWFYQALFLIPGKRFPIIQALNFVGNTLIVRCIALILQVRYRLPLMAWMFGFFDPMFRFLPALFTGIRIVFDCVDYPWHQYPPTLHQFQDGIPKLARRAWLVTANSRTLTAYLKQFRTDTVTVPLGFRSNAFTKYRSSTHSRRSQKPVIGLVGAIDYRLDFPLLEILIRNHPGWQFCLVGHLYYDNISPSQRASLERILQSGNVSHREVPPMQVPRILSRFTVGIIPYDPRLSFNRYSFPMKIVEYFYTGIPTVSTTIYELSYYSRFVRCTDTVRGWHDAITSYLNRPLSPARKDAMRAEALRHTWEKKLEAIYRAIDARDPMGHGIT